MSWHNNIVFVCRHIVSSGLGYDREALFCHPEIYRVSNLRVVEYIP
jgi:hypothetical protein